ncbi:hypothetical protein PENSUB_1675 [Penicillium subrubescens]|uniref:Uncharacterized protein n=1 Tax=Penicillium subrubescens TaxID=1316194 RepID=A0A1Q5UJE7_9EURO|nr:hypothetical protein PENSUB_1675 [Penicillium subrubescens]
MANRDSDNHQAQSQLDGLDHNPDNVQVQGSQLEDQTKISTGTNTISIKRKRAPPGATSDEVADTEDLPEYNREITDVLCTLGDRFEVEDWIDRHLQSWKRALEKKSKARKITEELPVSTSVSFTDSVYQIPPPGVKLSDEHVYLISKHLSINDRKGKLPEDFNSGGDLLATHVPTDPAPLFHAWGIPFIAVSGAILSSAEGRPPSAMVPPSTSRTGLPQAPQVLTGLLAQLSPTQRL